MELTQAVELVVKDTHQSYPEMTPAEAVEHVQATLDIEDLYFSDEQDELYQAYRLVLESEDAAIFAAAELDA